MVDHSPFYPTNKSNNMNSLDSNEPNVTKYFSRDSYIGREQCMSKFTIFLKKYDKAESIIISDRIIQTQSKETSGRRQKAIKGKFTFS